MSHSLLRADSRTHLKIAAVALIAAAVVVAVGISARMTESQTAAVRLEGPVLKAGQPSTYTSTEAPPIR